MAGYERRNRTVIKRAFNRLVGNKDLVMQKGLSQLLDDAMLYALGEHDNRHWLHKSTGDSYGWLVLHDGQHVAHKVNEGRHGQGNAYASLMAVAGQVSPSGWVGILLASMEGETPMYFAVDYEMDILHETVDVTKDNFYQYFKPIVQ